MNGNEITSSSIGWAITVIGFIVVIIVLAVLALIKQKRRQIDRAPLSEERREHILSHTPVIQPDLAAAELGILYDPEAAVRIYQPLTTSLGEKFHLSKLYQLFNQENIAHPHLTIRSLREAGYLVLVEPELFRWKNV